MRKTSSSSPTRRASLHQKKTAVIPYSYTLLVVALLHASVWSIGVCEAHSRQFFLREHDNIQAAASSNPTSLSGLLSQHLEALRRLIDAPRERLRELVQQRLTLQARHRASAKSAAQANRLIGADSDLVPLSLLFAPLYEQKTPSGRNFAGAAAAAAAVPSAPVTPFAAVFAASA